MPPNVSPKQMFRNRTATTIQPRVGAPQPETRTLQATPLLETPEPAIWSIFPAIPQVDNRPHRPIRRQLLENLNRESANAAPHSVPPAHKQQAAEDAAALLEFGAILVALPEHPDQAQAMTQSARAQVEDLTVHRLMDAVTELRELSKLENEPQPSGDAPRTAESFLEWLTRLDLQRAFQMENAEAEKLIENHRRWRALDQAFGPAANFWSVFEQLRKAN